MKTVHIPASTEYDVLIGEGVLSQAGTHIAAVCAPCKAAVITDDTVDAHYGSLLRNALEKAGFTPVTFVFPHGEASKNLTVLGDVLNFLAENRFSRSDLVIALGGGTVGDLAGFAAAVYLRGIRYVQIPTTLLAAVDASVGGKTAVDLACGKNLAGAFHQPALVLCDPRTLASLPSDIFRAGMAEVIKYAVLIGDPFFTQLEAHALPLGDLIAACVDCKCGLVAEDEFDHGRRQLLNLGHTVGHAVEVCSNFALPHGECVAAGLAVIARACVNEGLCSAEDCRRIYALLQQYDLPTATHFRADQLAAACLADKKIRGGTLTLVLPEAIGHCTLRQIPLADLRGWIAKGLALWI